MSLDRFDLINVPEQALVRAVLEKLRRTYDAFGFVFDRVRPDQGGWQYLFLCEVSRRSLGLDPRLQPGDFDIIIVPSAKGRLVTERAAAIEVKRLPLRAGVLGKNVGRYGITQALGLIRDGFPLVGILHIIVTEPGPPEHMRDLQQWRVLDEEQHVEYVRDFRADITGSLAADLQIHRLKANVCDERIGYNAIAFQRSRSDGEGFMVYPSYGRAASPNANISLEMLTKLAALIEYNRPFASFRD